MATTTLTFGSKINISLQVGDIVYYLNNSEDIKEIGPCTSVSDNVIVCNVTGNTGTLTTDSFIFFGKDNSKNTSGIIGYYAEVNLNNSSKDHAELFAVNSEIFISSN